MRRKLPAHSGFTPSRRLLSKNGYCRPGRYAHVPGLLRPALLSILLLILQLFLGIGSFWIRTITRDAVQPEQLAVAITTSHVAVCALLLAVILILTLEAFRLLMVPEKVSSFATLAQKATL